MTILHLSFFNIIQHERVKLLPTCHNCQKHWTWKQTIRSGCTIDRGMKCPYCQNKQHLTATSRKRMFLLTIVSILPLLLPMFHVPAIIPFILIVVLGVSNLLLYPFISK
ncbi:TIGR04104 family putative zinc finger protein [Halalkalibacter sp. APA_J-10(15)]|uniref:TIGR04104 family putative zinc finger protein n=1 Tax=Halalkalibacter sp. APA_J-10(15) TaxID=2933805 RepID=UPI0034D63CB1